MKVGILTLPLWHNYGGILQAYALRQAVQDLGHDALFMDVRRPKEARGVLVAKRLKRWLRRRLRGSGAPWYPDQDELAIISRNTRAFVDGRFNLKTEHMPVDAVMDVSNHLDAVIVGSDQVWRREYVPDLSTYFLAIPGDHPVRISYAASLGVDDWRFSSDETEEFGRSLRHFRAVSVREDSAIPLLERELSIQAVQVCDPTLLFDADHYRQVGGVSASAEMTSRRIFTYVLDLDSQGAAAIAGLARAIGGVPFEVMPLPFGPGFRRNDSRYVFPPVEDWLAAFNESDFVITNSFHGCVFSLIFNRPFIAVSNIERGKARFESLLERYGLSDRLFPSFSAVDVAALKPIDWGEVNRIRAEEKRVGLAFLSSALSPERDS